jgi:hypothetical protein
MTTKAREYIDFWIENSVHAAEENKAPGASQDVAELVRRLVWDARAQDITEQSLQYEVGDLTEFVRSKLADANRNERNRRPQTR